MLFRALRKLFTHRGEAGYEMNSRRDEYMDALREIHQAGAPAKQPSDAVRDEAQQALNRLEASRTPFDRSRRQ